MTLLLPQRARSRLVGSGQGAVRHITQWALPVWSTTQVCVPGHTTLEQDSAGKHRLGVTPGMAVPSPQLLHPRQALGIIPGKPSPLPPATGGQSRARGRGVLTSPSELLPRAGAGRGWHPEHRGAQDLECPGWALAGALPRGRSRGPAAAAAAGLSPLGAAGPGRAGGRTQVPWQGSGSRCGQAGSCRAGPGEREGQGHPGPEPALERGRTGVEGA